MLAMLGIRDRTLTWKLVRLLSVFASALSISLAGDGAVATSWRADTSGRKHEVDIRQHVVDAVRVVLNSPGVKHHRRLRVAVEACGLHNFFGGNASNFGRNLRCVLSCESLRVLPTIRAGVDERFVDQFFFNQDVQQTIGKRYVGTELEL